MMCDRDDLNFAIQDSIDHVEREFEHDEATAAATREWIPLWGLTDPRDGVIDLALECCCR